MGEGRGGSSWKMGSKVEPQTSPKMWAEEEDAARETEK